jgi:hypothetical protein
MEAFILIFGAILYFAPTGLAYLRKSVDLTKIALVNLLAGWTIIGWIAAMVMANSSQQKWQRDQSSH